jgi:GTP diphosphokinase / guanosine-3',5'-bis(diphosphate) 3'-diphosphatase
MILANEIPLDSISVVSALLHDVVEDTEVSLDFIAKEFGKEIADIVDGVTKIGGVFKGQEITQAENYRKLLISMVKDARVILVKFADRLHNMRQLEFIRPDKQRRISKETLEIYAPFANRFGLGKLRAELEDLSFKYLNKEAYEEIARKLSEKKKEREEYIVRFKKPLIEKLDEYSIQYEFSARTKHIYSIYKKMIKLNTTFENIYDLFAIRIILESNDNNECYYVLGVTNQLYKPIPHKFHDYISVPKKNNYQSIHNTVFGPDGRPVEIQIRTRRMHEIAEKGVAAHWKYKENFISSDKDLEEWVNWVRDIFQHANRDEASKEILDSFELNLYQDEIYVFTPKGDLRRLPLNATPVDYAFEVHSNVGYRCIGAKVNNKIVPLDTPLKSGDQVEIITSKNQKPNKSWLQFVKTHKAKNNIRKYLNKEEEILFNKGKEIWEKRLKKHNIILEQEDLSRFLRKNKYENFSQVYIDIASEKINLDELLEKFTKKEDKPAAEIKFDKFVSIARDSAKGIIIDGDAKGFEYSYAKCCNPIPGDPIIGYVTIGEGIKIHRRNCHNLLAQQNINDQRFVPVDWPNTEGSFFVAGILITGEDNPGILKDLSNTITSFQNTNIKAVNITTQDSMFKGAVAVYVKDLEHLNKLIDRLKKGKGIFTVERFDMQN